MHPKLAALAARDGGVFTRAQALSAGISSTEARRLLRSSEWVRLRHGVYVEREALEVHGDTSARHVPYVAAARLTLHAPDAVASHHSAALIYGIDLLRSPPPTVALTRAPEMVSSRTVHQGIDLHLAALPASHLDVRHSLPVTSASRTVIDLGRTLPFREGVVLADSALRKAGASARDLSAILRDCWSWPRIACAARVVDFADPRAETALESLARVVFAEQRLPPPETQVLLGDHELIGRVDFYWRGFRTVGEADGLLKYDDPAVLVAEKLRQERLEEAGFVVVRFTWHQIVHQPRQTAERIRRAFARGLARDR